MQNVIPSLRITSYKQSKAFYVDGLGFHIDWEHRFEPHFPVFLQITREDMTIYLSEHAGDCQVGGLIHFFVPDVDAWYQEFQQKGVPITEPPSESLPRLRNMTVTDPDGNQLRILTPIEEQSA